MRFVKRSSPEEVTLDFAAPRCDGLTLGGKQHRSPAQPLPRASLSCTGAVERQLSCFIHMDCTCLLASTSLQGKKPTGKDARFTRFQNESINTRTRDCDSFAQEERTHSPARHAVTAFLRGSGLGAVCGFMSQEESWGNSLLSSVLKDSYGDQLL